jgi:hypothetical protein
VTALGGPALWYVYLVCRVLDPMRSQATCVSSDSGSSKVTGSCVALGGPCNVRSLLSCTWLIWQNDLPKTYIDVTWGLAK